MHAARAHAPVAVRVPLAQPNVRALVEPVSWLMHSAAQRLLAALLVIAAVLAAMVWAISAQG
ncbi:MAG: hypothetical protein RJA36_2885 [Pseudomonadota bacterium]